MNINLDNPTRTFIDHLSKPNNVRILFSGPFGYGKTYFLNHFFSNNDEYTPFWLSPVKYIVGQNEDIFEYIKIDIALQLLISPELITEKTPKFREDLYIHQYLRNKPYEVALLLSQTINDLNIPLVKQAASTISNALKAREKYESWKDELKRKDKTDFEKLIDFSLSHSAIKGSIYEDDIITQLIRLNLELIKNSSNKSNILIIDDFDRLDPEHIFRILNILSVHQSYTESENKFGFDKIVIVCSIDNLKKIYEYKYGKDVDFEGYIEKFYSTDIFHFNNQSAIASYCESQFSTSLDEDSLSILGILLSFFVITNQLSVRSIIKYQYISQIRSFVIGPFPFLLEFDKIADAVVTNDRRGNQIVNKTIWGNNFKDPIKHTQSSFYISSDDFPVLKLIQILTTIFGDYNSLKDAILLSNNTEAKFSNELNSSFIKSFMPLYHVASNYKDSKNIFSNQFIFTDRGWSNEPKALSINLPQSKVFENPIIIKLGWNESNQYDGTTSFYLHVNDLFDKKAEYANFDINHISKILNLLKTILFFLENEGFLSNLGITN